jgi:hypothetical protein
MKNCKYFLLHIHILSNIIEFIINLHLLEALSNFKDLHIANLETLHDKLF